MSLSFSPCDILQIGSDKKEIETSLLVQNQYQYIGNIKLYPILS